MAIPFPPSGPTSLTKTLLAYLYQQYSDDDDLQAFVAAYNGLTQQYVDWFVQIGLPVYTGPMIIGPLLDWVLGGFYGLTRPTMSSGQTKTLGPYNTTPFGFNLPYGDEVVTGPTNFAATTDDIYKRIATWHFYKGDGKVFNIGWLKRRIMRFLIGVNGTAPPISDTPQISITFGPSGTVNIVIRQGFTAVTGGDLLMRFDLPLRSNIPLGAVRTTFTPGISLSVAASILVEALNSGALELPFQIADNFTVTVF